MNSHELARFLLQLPDLPVATHANNHDYFSNQLHKLRIGLAHHYSGQYILIGNFDRRELNPPNWYVEKVLVGYISEDYKDENGVWLGTPNTASSGRLQGSDSQ